MQHARLRLLCAGEDIERKSLDNLHASKEGVEFFAFDGTIRTFFQITERDVHNPNTLKIIDFLEERYTHATDLVFLSFGKDDTECVFIDDLHLTGSGCSVFNANTSLHLSFKVVAEGFLCCYEVFLFVRIEWREHAIGDAPVVGENHETVGILVETTNREDVTKRYNMFDFLVTSLRRVGDDAARFVVGKIDILGGFLVSSEPHFNVVVLVDLVTQHSQSTIEKDLLFFDELIGTSTGGLFFECQKLVDTHRKSRFRRHCKWLRGVPLGFSCRLWVLLVFHVGSVPRASKRAP